jgi:hypothetical protein
MYLQCDRRSVALTRSACSNRSRTLVTREPPIARNKTVEATPPGSEVIPS